MNNKSNPKKSTMSNNNNNNDVINPSEYSPAKSINQQLNQIQTILRSYFQNPYWKII